MSGKIKLASKIKILGAWITTKSDIPGVSINPIIHIYDDKKLVWLLPHCCSGENVFFFSYKIKNGLLIWKNKISSSKKNPPKLFFDNQKLVMEWNNKKTWFRRFNCDDAISMLINTLHKIPRDNRRNR